MNKTHLVKTTMTTSYTTITTITTITAKTHSIIPSRTSSSTSTPSRLSTRSRSPSSKRPQSTPRHSTTIRSCHITSASPGTLSTQASSGVITLTSWQSGRRRNSCRRTLQSARLRSTPSLHNASLPCHHSRLQPATKTSPMSLVGSR